jgi:glycosyltransferase involved in cell wall biosynthesis
MNDVPAAPRVSVIMIFLDAVAYIEEAIESVFSQSFPSWELLLVDDGSTDGSSAIARTFARCYPERVRYLEHPEHANRGMSASRNLGLLHARGEYVALLDADDVYLPNKLGEQVPLLDSMPDAGMLYGRTRYWFSWTGEPADRDRDFLTAAAPRLDALFEPPELLAAYLDHEVFFPCTCSVLIRRSLLQEVGGFVDEFRGTYEDMAIYSKIFVRSRAYVADRCWDQYRQHPESSWAVAVREGQYVHARPNEVRYALLSWLNDYLRCQGLGWSSIGRKVRRKVLPYRYPRLYRGIGAFQRGWRRVRDRLRSRSEALSAAR